MNHPEHSLTTAEAAQLLRTSTRQVQRELAAGRLKGVRHGHGWRITRLEVWRYLGIADAMLELWLEHLARTSSDGPRQPEARSGERP